MEGGKTKTAVDKNGRLLKKSTKIYLFEDKVSLCKNVPRLRTAVFLTLATRNYRHDVKVCLETGVYGISLLLVVK